MKFKRLSRKGETRSMTKGFIAGENKTNSPVPPPPAEEELKKGKWNFAVTLNGEEIDFDSPKSEPEEIEPSKLAIELRQECDELLTGLYAEGLTSDEFTKRFTKGMDEIFGKRGLDWGIGGIR